MGIWQDMGAVYLVVGLGTLVWGRMTFEFFDSTSLIRWLAVSTFVVLLWPFFWMVAWEELHK